MVGEGSPSTPWVRKAKGVDADVHRHDGVVVGRGFNEDWYYANSPFKAMSPTQI
jgi:hypothetical protein